MSQLHAGKSPERVFDEFKDFVATIRQKLSNTEIVFIGLSPSVARVTEAEATKKLNALVRAYVKQTPRVKYVKTYEMSLGPDGQPRPDLFIADKLHFNAEGYKLLAARVRPFVKK